MNFIFKESQIEKLLEMDFSLGTFDWRDNSYYNVFSLLYNIKEDKLLKLVKFYLKNILGYRKKMSDDDIREYIDDITNGTLEGFSNRELKRPDVLSNLAYFLAKKIWGLKKGSKLEFLVNFEKNIDSMEYIFFDSELEMSVGAISVVDLGGSSNFPIKLPKRSYQVSLAGIDKELKGRGYGKDMYITLIENFNLLASDAILYRDSLNIWVNVLPKIYHVYAIMYDNEKPVRKITPTGKIPDSEDIKRFIVVKDPSLIKIKKNFFE